MNTSLLQNLSLTEYRFAKALPLERCEIFARLANLKITFTDPAHPGQQLIKTLDRSGMTTEAYKDILNTTLNTKIIRTYYKPHSKVAILIANDKYSNLPKLATPSIDCDSVGSCMKILEFIVVTVKNTQSCILKSILGDIVRVIPENSYCFLFYAGHGCEISNTKCILSTDCPDSNINDNHYVTENHLLNEIAKCRPETCVCIMDMCRNTLDRESNPQLYTSILSTPPLQIDSNLLVSYSTLSSQSAYEMLQIECSTTLDSGVTYELGPGDTDRIVPTASQYVNALCTRLTDETDISTMLDKVHADVENARKKQRPLKLQCGAARRSLYDPATGDPASLLSALKEACKNYKYYCNVF